MFLTSLEFYFFFFIVMAAMFFLQKQPLLQKKMLLLAGLCFYTYIDSVMVLLLLLSSLLTQVIALKIYTAQGKREQRIFLTVGVCINLFVLIYFKYFNFFIASIVEVFCADAGTGMSLNIMIPLGVSFYIFRFISYLIDIYRQDSTPCSLLDFLIYATFFPVMVAGPISRVNYFVPQLAVIHLSFSRLYQGYRLFVIGLFLKVFVADRLAYFVNFFYDNHEVFNCLTAWLAILAYTLQIYSDFAGYSSMAIGMSLMLGIQIEENFNFPYLAGSIVEFWKRWHMTLSSWIKDYLYIPLGGSRRGTVRKYINLLLAMTLCGLWHGAAWTFVLWGLLHGILLIINHLWRGTSYRDSMLKFPRFYGFLTWFCSFFSVTLCWVVFRSANIDQAVTIIQALFSVSNEGIFWPEPFVIFILAAAAFLHIFVYFDVKSVTLPVKSAYTPTILFCLIWLVIVFYPKEFQPFVYAQF